MIILPSLLVHTKQRPNRPQFEESYLIPDFKKYPEFWETIHSQLFNLSVYSPIKMDLENRINPHYGFFGNRIHPVTFEPGYYHLGIELYTDQKQLVYPLLKGDLEYSGYGAVNGYYVLLSHPHIQTADGYIFHTMYCHLKKPLVKFSSYQKMLREISLGSYPVVPVNADTILGQAGKTGVTSSDKPRLYIQCDFRKFDETPIVVDPAHFFSMETHQNTSRHSNDIEGFKKQISE